MYGSYLNAKDDVATPAIWTVIGDTGSSLLAGLAIIPAVFALGMQPTQGPTLIFATLPKVFAAIPAGWIFGFLFFGGLFGAGYLSDVGAIEVLVAGLTDNMKITHTRAVWIMTAACFVFAIPPSINNAIFLPWDLTFDSGMQTPHSLVAVITVGWCIHRSAALKELSRESGARPIPMWLFYWIRFGIPAAILTVGIRWRCSATCFPTVPGVLTHARVRQQFQRLVTAFSKEAGVRIVSRAPRDLARSFDSHGRGRPLRWPLVRLAKEEGGRGDLCRRRISPA